MKPTQTIHYIKGKSFQITIHFALFDSPKKWVPLTCFSSSLISSLRVDTTKVGENLAKRTFWVKLRWHSKKRQEKSHL